MLRFKKKGTGEAAGFRRPDGPALQNMGENESMWLLAW